MGVPQPGPVFNLSRPMVIGFTIDTDLAARRIAGGRLRRCRPAADVRGGLLRLAMGAVIGAGR